MLKKAWNRFNAHKHLVGYDISLFNWLEKIKPDLREKIAPGIYDQYGKNLIRTSINHLRRVDWKIIENIGYQLSVAELKRLAQNGDQRAIEILNEA